MREDVGMNAVYKGVIREGRVEVRDPIRLPEGAEVVVSLQESDTMSAEEIAHVHAAMQRLVELNIASDEPLDGCAHERS
jgi:hypothetical protein